MRDKLRIGFVGAGFMGQKAHLANYAALDDCRVVAVAEPRLKVAEEVARRYGIENIYANHRELLEKCEVDAIVAAQPYNHHFSLIPDILRAKKPVFTEKPVALSVEAGENLAKLAEDQGVLYMVGYHKRSDPATEYARKIIEQWKTSGEYGKMKLVRITMPDGDWIGGAPRNEVSSDEPYPPVEMEPMPEYFSAEVGEKYNAFVNYYIHQVNAMRFMFGEPYKVVFADKSGVLMVTQSESGICGTIEMAPYRNTSDWQEVIFAAFEKGYVKVELPAPLASQQPGRVTVMRDNGTEPATITQPLLPKIHAMRNQAMNFLAAVRGERPAPCDAREAVEDLKVARDYIRLLYS